MSKKSKNPKHSKVLVEIKKKKVHSKVVRPKPVPNVVARLPNNPISRQFGRADVTLATAAAILHPFQAYSNQCQVGLPFEVNASPYFGFWTRDIVQVNAVACTGGVNGSQAMFVAYPWHMSCNETATVIAATGAITSVSAADCVAAGFINANFNKACVTHMGMRVRNLSEVLVQNGDMTVGISTKEDLYSATRDMRRMNAKSYTRAGAGSGVLSEISWIGNMTTDDQGPAAIDDYVMCDASGDAFDEDLTVLYFQACTDSNAIYEVEIVRHFLLEPSIATASFTPAVRSSVDVPRLLDILDGAYARVPQFDLKRCAIKDDGDVFDDFRGVWKGFKALTRLPGSVWQTVSNIASLSQANIFKDIIKRIPAEQYKRFVAHLTKFNDAKSAIKGLVADQDEKSVHSTYYSIDTKRR